MAGHHHHPHAHDHGGGHHRHDAPRTNAIFALSIGLNFAYATIEAVFGVITGSLGLIADAGHNLSDVLSLLLAWLALRLAQRPPSGRRTYGWRRATIMAALANAILLLVAVGGIGFEAIRRLSDPAPVATATVIWVAAIGVLINAGTAMLLMRAGDRHDLNLRGAVAHMMADAAVTVGVILGAVLIGLTGWIWIDPAIALLIGLVILLGTWSLLRDSSAMAMDMAPAQIVPEAVEAWLASQPAVTEVHDLHIWALGTADIALTVHLVRPGRGPDDAFLAALGAGLRARFGITHVTIQIEAGDRAHPCPQAPAATL